MPAVTRRRPGNGRRSVVTCRDRARSRGKVGSGGRGHFDDTIAKIYRDKWPHLFDPALVDPAVDFLAELSSVGNALESGIGTGRLAVPLSRRGIRVHGIELSAAMVEGEIATRTDEAPDPKVRTLPM